jgi:hypothetical protein
MAVEAAYKGKYSNKSIRIGKQEYLQQRIAAAV